MAEGIRQRTFLGLRADEEWVRAVSADPGARTTYGIPLTLAEEADLNARERARRNSAPSSSNTPPSIPTTSPGCASTTTGVACW